MKYCKVCLDNLDSGINWSAGSEEKHYHICIPCLKHRQHSWHKESYITKERKTKANNPYCRVCMDNLEEEINWYPCHKKYRLYLCKLCMRHRHLTRYTNNRDYVRAQQSEAVALKYKMKRRQINLKKYNLTLDNYETIKLKQNNVCAICKEKDKTWENLSVDHCHTSSKVRGLLCNKCNTGIGLFGDNINTLKAAIDYLERNK